MVIPQYEHDLLIRELRFESDNDRNDGWVKEHYRRLLKSVDNVKTATHDYSTSLCNRSDMHMYATNMKTFYERARATPFDESELGEIINMLGLNLTKDGPWICGGAVRRTLLGASIDSDIDIFSSSAEQLDAAVEHLLNVLDDRNINHHTNSRNTSMVHEVVVKLPHQSSEKNDGIKSVKVQFIKKYYPSVNDVLDSFDFTICQFGYDGENLFHGEYSLWDLGRRRLAVNRITRPVSSIRRLVKYSNQGFTFCNGTITSILASAGVDVKTLADSGILVDYID